MNVIKTLSTSSVCILLIVCSLTPAKAQKTENLWSKWSKDNQPATPTDIKFERDISYRTGHSRWVLNVIYSKEAPKVKKPAIIIIHGGGWSGNDQYRFSSLGFYLARKGYVVIAPTHRMIRDAPFPACLIDIKNVVRWVRANADKYQVDSKHIGAYGNSSGGQLALMTALTSGVSQLEGQGTHLEQSSAIQAVVCSGTVGDMMHKDHSEIAERVYRSLVGQRANQLSELQLNKALNQASPVTHLKAGIPPVLMIHGEKDDIVHIASTDEFVNKMKSLSLKIKYLRYSDSGHGVMAHKQKETIPSMLSFFAEHLKQ